MTPENYETFKKTYLKSFKKTYKNSSKEQRKLLLLEIENQPRLSDRQKKHLVQSVKGTKQKHRQTKKVLTYKVLEKDEISVKQRKNNK